MMGWETTLWIDERQHAGLGIGPSAHAPTLLRDHLPPEDLCQQPAKGAAVSRGIGMARKEAARVAFKAI
jgi:hypothetical protein